MDIQTNNNNRGIQLLKKGKLGIWRVIFSRGGLFMILLLIQFSIPLIIFSKFENFSSHYYAVTLLIYVCIILYLLNSRINPTAKITWLVLIMLAPVLAIAMLIYTKTDIGHRAIKDRLANLMKETEDCIPQDLSVKDSLEKISPESISLTKFLNRAGCYPAYDNTQVKYFPLGEDKFNQLMIELEKAQQFIFMEYFIVHEGIMWGKILEILARKAKTGVEVRLMYDGTCEFSTLPHDYPKKLEALGIQCKMFSPITPFISTHYNYRDHRKIAVIDGHTAFTGGINLADEYINETDRFGHWKDTAIMLKGEAVKSFTLMFLQLWNITEKNPQFDKYLSYPAEDVIKTKGYVIPFGDSPLDDEKAGEMVYIDILNRANKYVHIMTPYLILDGEMETALKFAAERGIDVAIILPGIPDKKAANALAKTHYASLMDSGVKIYEYTPGFVHAKVFVSDDIKAVVGTINLDYRSLYHHFECAAYMYDTECIDDIERDFQDTLSKCSRVTKETIRNEKLMVKLRGRLLKVVAPLM